ncbi:hypothetical protein CYV15_08740 [Riemerella anatipestifer]|uniref:hypothetical protein n=1 Tax=Riemerella anatipestifer TaxID=34085 RepID=UPI000D14077B|nr:hypothetical protein [Riemerella anatipestifer]PST43553.1 hypothetical protein CYV15_08740 [Riemerella anatipestifer]
MDNFLDDLQAIVDKKCITITNEEVRCLGAFCGWKEKEGVIKNYTYKKIMDEAPGFCSENEF